MRISRELHDEAGQSLTALMINLDMLQADLPGEDEILHQRVEACVDLVHETIDLIRHLAQDLRPPASGYPGTEPDVGRILPGVHSPDAYSDHLPRF